ncbi:hypothetical protein GCM10010399_44290 [Dactylosporangium fulvum]|uniref:Uncharacterized protein n=1 Tax=Dactylosporangium fulvum TaxID=53359 RepID=A0ABY5WB37_9ACTN|nr:hypothetical protein [Dactylosporangium fulvum]UWP85903.1 hypothetical protein Dfulv_17290 [Dactylosporangium fulvum]
MASDPNRVISEVNKLIGEAFIRANAVLAAAFVDMLAGRPTREIADYARELGFTEPPAENLGITEGEDPRHGNH